MIRVKVGAINAGGAGGAKVLAGKLFLLATLAPAMTFERRKTADVMKTTSQ